MNKKKEIMNQLAHLQETLNRFPLALTKFDEKTTRFTRRTSTQ